MIRKRSSHMPTDTATAAATQPKTVRRARLLRMASGSTKLQTTIVQNIGAKLPRSVTRSVFTSEVLLPYQVVRRSLNVK